MTVAATPSAPGSHLVLYDGVCALCNRLVQFILAHDHAGRFNFAPLQSALGQRLVAKTGADPLALSTLYVLANYRSDQQRILTRSDASLFVVSELPWPWWILRIGGVFPKALLDRAYNLVARTRYRIFGRVDQCLLPRPEFKSRFLE